MNHVRHPLTNILRLDVIVQLSALFRGGDRVGIPGYFEVAITQSANAARDGGHGISCP